MAHPDRFPTEETQDQERQRLFRLIEELVKWENTTNETVLQQARNEIWRSWRTTCAENADHPRAKELFDPEKLPSFHDPFASGGALPLEAQRLGLESYASDLNPVAVLINKAMAAAIYALGERDDKSLLIFPAVIPIDNKDVDGAATAPLALDCA